MPVCCHPPVLLRHLQLALPLSRSGLANKSDKDLRELSSSIKRSKSAVRLEDEETVVVDVTRLHRKEVSRGSKGKRGQAEREAAAAAASWCAVLC